jgi:hypothetical protein
MSAPEGPRDPEDPAFQDLVGQVARAILQQIGPGDGQVQHQAGIPYAGMAAPQGYSGMYSNMAGGMQDMAPGMMPGMMPSGMAPGMAPSGMMPSGMMPNGMMPSGYMAGPGVPAPMQYNGMQDMGAAQQPTSNPLVAAERMYAQQSLVKNEHYADKLGQPLSQGNDAMGMLGDRGSVKTFATPEILRRAKLARQAAMDETAKAIENMDKQQSATKNAENDGFFARWDDDGLTEAEPVPDDPEIASIAKSPPAAPPSPPPPPSKEELLEESLRKSRLATKKERKPLADQASLGMFETVKPGYAVPTGLDSEDDEDVDEGGKSIAADGVVQRMLRRDTTARTDLLDLAVKPRGRYRVDRDSWNVTEDGTILEDETPEDVDDE